MTFVAGTVLTAAALNTALAAKAALASPTFGTLVRVSDGVGTVTLQQAAHTTYLSNANAAGDVQFYLGGTERMRLAASGLLTGTGPSLGAWTAWTPVLSGAGWAIGNGTLVGRYSLIGKRMAFRLAFTFGSTTTVGSVDPMFSYPVGVTAETTVNPIGMHAAVSLVDVSAAGVFTGRCAGDSYSGFYAARTDSALKSQLITATAPFTWAAGDLILVSGHVETN